MKVLERDAPHGLDDAFADLPHVVYADDPHWIPEEEAVLRRALGPSNPWFARGRAITLCVAGRARLAVFRTPARAVEGRQAAFVGMFESDGHEAPVRELLRRAAEWARGQGAEALYGPVDFDTFGNYRLRTAAEEGGLPFPGEPYNRPEYPGLLEGAGFSAVRHYVSQVSAGAVHADVRQRDAARSLAAAGYVLEPLDGTRWMTLLPELHGAADQIFGDAFAYAPIPYEEFAVRYGAGVANRLCPHTSLIARGPVGELAAFLLCYPHYGPLVVQGSALGRVPVTELAYAVHQPVLAAAGERTAIAKTVGVAPAHRQRGLVSALGAAAVQRGAGRYDRWVAALMRADNPSRRFGEPHARHQREYALYGRTLTDVPLTAAPP